MKFIIILFSVLLMTWPGRANAQPITDVALSRTAGVLFSSIIFPLAGLLIDQGENAPYWKAVGITVVSSGVGAFGASRVKYDNPFKANPQDFWYPFVLGAVGSYLTFRYLSPQSDKSTSALWQYAPKVSVLPVARGGSIRLNWSF